MTEPPPTCLDDIGNDDEELVKLWWRRSDHLMAGEMKNARALDWVHGAVNDRMTFDDTDGTVWLLDRLLEQPHKDIQTAMNVVADNILNELLETRGNEVAPMIADLATRHDRWQAALTAVDLDPEHREAIPALAPYLSTRAPETDPVRVRPEPTPHAP